jgi:hypothetical protein
MNKRTAYAIGLLFAILILVCGLFMQRGYNLEGLTTINKPTTTTPTTTTPTGRFDSSDTKLRAVAKDALNGKFITPPSGFNDSSYLPLPPQNSTPEYGRVFTSVFWYLRNNGLDKNDSIQKATQYAKPYFRR